MTNIRCQREDGTLVLTVHVPEDVWDAASWADHFITTETKLNVVDWLSATTLVVA